MLVAITGTPGVGKSSVSKILAQRFPVIDIHNYAEKHNLFEEFDEEAGSYNVDVEKLNDSIMSEDLDSTVFLDGHLSHFVDCDIIIVLRCDPHILYKRLKDRGYDEKKVLENVQAEVLDVILSECDAPKVLTMPGWGMYIESYSSKFSLMYEDPEGGDLSRYDEETAGVITELQKVSPDMKKVAAAARRCGCGYVILSTDLWPAKPITGYGYDLIFESDTCVVYREVKTP